MLSKFHRHVGSACCEQLMKIMVEYSRSFSSGKKKKRLRNPIRKLRCNPFSKRKFYFFLFCVFWLKDNHFRFTKSHIQKRTRTCMEKDWISRNLIRQTSKGIKSYPQNVQLAARTFGKISDAMRLSSFRP